MLSKAENEYLTRIGPGTPMGTLFRRFWLPAVLSNELPEPDCSPLRLRLLCEDLVAFRDSGGQVAIMEARCPHKLAHLFFGRNEDYGLRCTYHGWKFDATGACVDMPNEPPDSNFRSKIRQLAYPTREQGGVVWVYMGPLDKQPQELPQLEWVRAPEGYQHVSKWLQRTNWAQGMEGEIDTTHLSFLHSTQRPYLDSLSRTRAVGNAALRKAQADGMPRLTLRETPYGFTYGARRNTNDGEYYWRVTRWLYPFFSLIAGNLGTGGRAWVPIDDEHTWTFSYQCHPDQPYSEEERAEFQQGWGLPPRLTRGTYTLKDGYKIDTWLPAANMENDYLIDREMQKDTNFSGIWGINEQDRSLQENMGQIVDRSREHLGISDIAGIAARRLLINMARDLENGIEPEIARNTDAYRLRAIDVVSPIGDFDELLEAHHTGLGVAKV